MVSIDGNAVKTYSSKEDIADFVESIKDYYNIEEFDDMTVDLILVVINAEIFSLMSLLCRE